MVSRRMSKTFTSLRNCAWCLPEELTSIIPVCGQTIFAPCRTLSGEDLNLLVVFYLEEFCRLSQNLAKWFLPWVIRGDCREEFFFLEIPSKWLIRSLLTATHGQFLEERITTHTWYEFHKLSLWLDCVFLSVTNVVLTVFLKYKNVFLIWFMQFFCW